MRKSFLWAYSLAVFSCVLCGIASAAPVITTNLFVDLNSDSTSNFLTNGSNRIQAWYDLAGNDAASQQDYGVDGTAATNMPLLSLNFEMPDGGLANIVSFDRGTTNDDTSDAGSEWLLSKTGGTARTTTHGSAFTPGADTAYDVTAVSWFTVFRTTKPAGTAEADSGKRQSVFRVATSGAEASTSKYGTAFQDNYAGEGHTEAGGDLTFELGTNARGSAGNAVNNAGNVTDQWYISGNSWDPATGKLYTHVISQDGTVNFMQTNTANVNGSPGPHLLSTLGRQSTVLSPVPSSANLNALQGSIAEHLMYSTALSTGDVTTVMNYLNDKYFLIATKEWNSTTTTDWATAGNWSVAGVPDTTDNVVFRSGSSTINSVNVGAPRTVGSVTFNGNQSSFEITDLTTTNTLTINPAADSTTAADITVTSGHVKIKGSATLLGTDSAASGDIVAGGIKDTDWFVVDVAANASLDVQASISSVTTAGRRAHFVKQGEGVLTLSSINQLDLRPQTTGVNGGIFVDAGTLQFAADGARGNPFTPVTVADGATLEFVNAGYDGSFFGANGSSDSGANGNRSILTLSGSGVGGNGALYNSAGPNRLASGGNSSATAAGLLGPGLIVLATDTSIGVAAGTRLTISHGITNVSSYETVGGVGGTGTAGKLTKVGLGTLIFDANNDSARNGYSQEIIVSQGTFLVNSPTTASARTGGLVTLSTAGVSTTVTLPNEGDTNGLFIGQPVTFTDPSSGTTTFPSNAVIAAIGTDGKTFRISENMTGPNSSMETVNVGFGAVTSALHTSPVTVKTGGTLGGTGSILGSTVTVEAGGTLAPGASVGTFTVGNATIGGTLKIEFGSDAIDRLTVAGTLDITNAILDVSALGSLVNGEYVFATYDVLVGSGFTVAPPLPGSLTLHHDTTNKYFSLIGSYSASLPGDYNGDNKVDSADYVIWRKGGSPDSTVAGYNLWRAHFGNPPGSGSGSELNGTSAVPEPASLGLIVLGAVLLIGGRRASNRALKS